MDEEEYMLSPRGGPSGPFWGVVTTIGKVIAMQILDEEWAQFLVFCGNYMSKHHITLNELTNQIDNRRSPE